MNNAIRAMDDAFCGKVLASRPHEKFEECTEFDIHLGKKKFTFIVFWSEDARFNAVKAHISKDIEHFPPEFLQMYMPYHVVFPIEAIVVIKQLPLANELLIEMLNQNIVHFAHLVQYVIDGKGYGHFFASVDGEEQEHEFEEVIYYFYKIGEVKLAKKA
eukprot:gene25475-28794_t